MLEATQQCRASVDTPRARAYLADQRIVPETVLMAVMVQRLVLADVAGLSFSADPRNGVHDTFIEASRGLEANLVSGRVQPEVFHLDRLRAPCWKRANRVGPPKSAAGRSPKKGVSGQPEQSPFFIFRDLDAASRFGRHIEAHFGRPQNMERPGQLGLSYRRSAQGIWVSAMCWCARRPIRLGPRCLSTPWRFSSNGGRSLPRCSGRA